MSSFQDSKILRFQDLKIPKFQSFELSKFQSSKISKFQSVKIPKPQYAKIPAFQDLNNYNFSNAQGSKIPRFPNNQKFQISDIDNIFPTLIMLAFFVFM